MHLDALVPFLDRSLGVNLGNIVVTVFDRLLHLLLDLVLLLRSGERRCFTRTLR